MYILQYHIFETFGIVIKFLIYHIYNDWFINTFNIFNFKKKILTVQCTTLFNRISIFLAEYVGVRLQYNDGNV